MNINNVLPQMNPLQAMQPVSTKSVRSVRSGKNLVNPQQTFDKQSKQTFTCAIAKGQLRLTKKSPSNVREGAINAPRIADNAKKRERLNRLQPEISTA